ncbi:MAG: hypothetical protein HFG75_03920 [Hungatella sp.]|nr:hypothetical protein [Hungatella sp.]
MTDRGWPIEAGPCFAGFVWLHDRKGFWHLNPIEKRNSAYRKKIYCEKEKIEYDIGYGNRKIHWKTREKRMGRDGERQEEI